MAQYQRLCSGYSIMERAKMRSAMAMIELIFAIVIIAISVIAIPSMMAVANQVSKTVMIDDDVMSRLLGWTMDKFQARWDGNYAASGSGILGASGSDLNCSRIVASVRYRENNNSNAQCDDLNRTASVIPTPQGSGILANGIEQLNGGLETIRIISASGTEYDVNASYAVSYVSSALDAPPVGNTATATWIIGSSTDMDPAPSSLTVPTHLKRIVTRFYDPVTQTDTVLTFFKSNKGN